MFILLVLLSKELVGIMPVGILSELGLHLQFVCHVITAICFWNMDIVESSYNETGGILGNEPKANTWHRLILIWFVTNVEVATLTHLPSINVAINRKRHPLFGHVRRMDPAYQALHLSVTSRQGSRQFGTCRRQPGRPRKCWVEQVATSTGLSPSDAWSVATYRSTWMALRPVDGQACKLERERERERARD